jgi:hypothetical protein
MIEPRRWKQGVGLSPTADVTAQALFGSGEKPLCVFTHPGSNAPFCAPARHVRFTPISRPFQNDAGFALGLQAEQRVGHVASAGNINWPLLARACEVIE